MNWTLVRLPLKSPNLDASVVQRAALKSFWEGCPLRILSKSKKRGQAKCDFFYFLSPRGFFFVLSLSSFFSVVTLLYPLCLPLHPRPPNFTHVWLIYPPPPSCTFCDCPAHPLPPEIARVAPPNPSFCFPLGPISKGWSTTMCSAVGAGPSKVPPQPPYLPPPSISLTLTSLFFFARPKKAQHFPVRKVVRPP